MLKSFLSNMTFRKTIGLVIGDREVAASLVADTLLGPVTVAHYRETYEPDGLLQALNKLLQPFRDKRQRLRAPIAVGLPDLRVFFSTRPIQAADQDVSPEVLLHEVLQSPNILVDDMTVDLIKAQPGNRPIASLVSCRKKYLASLLATLEEAGVKPYRAEPEPCALLRAVAYRYRTPRKAKTVIRVILGESRGLAILVNGELPLIWRSFDLSGGSAREVVVATVLAVQILGRYCGVEEGADTVMIHGRPDLGDELAPDSLEEPLGVRVIRSAGPAFDPSAVCHGLAIGCHQNVQAFDLARNLKPLPSAWEIIP